MSSNSCSTPPLEMRSRYRNGSLRSIVATNRPSGCTRMPLAATSPVADSTTAISCVAGSMARTQTPVRVRCIPRKENGSPWRASTIARISGSVCRRTLSLPGPRQNAENALQRYVYPAGPISQLVRNLVESFFEREEGQHRARQALARRIGRAAAHRLAIGGAKPVYGPLLPCFGQLHHSLLGRRPCFGELPHGGDARVIKRADHSRDIAQRRTLAPAVGEGPRRLTLEVDNKKVVLYDENLAEVEVPVKARFQGLDPVRNQQANLTEQNVATADQTVCEILSRDGQFGTLALQFGQHITGGVLDLAPPLGDVRATDRFRGKIGITATLLGQSPVHFGSADPKLARQCKKENIGIGQIGRLGAARQQSIVEVTGEIIQRLRPPVPLIARKAEQDAESMSFLPIMPSQVDFHKSQKRRRVGEPGALNQEPRHLDLGMRTRLQATIDLQHPVIGEDDRTVRLLHSGAANHEALRHLHLVEYWRLATADLAALQRHCRLLPDRVHHGQCKAVLRDGIDKRPLSAELAQFGEGGRDQPLPQLGL